MSAFAMTPLDLQCFCADEDCLRYNKPWTRNGYTWATNGHILVRVPELANVPENPGAPQAERIWDSAHVPGRWRKVPKVAMPEPIMCEFCRGTGKDREDRRYKCVACDGKGTEPDYKSNRMIGPAHFALRYLALIQGWEIAPTGPKTAAWIRSGDAMGLLMPMRV